MADLNGLLEKVVKEGTELDTRIRQLLSDYEDLYRETSQEFTAERLRTGSMDGLQEFYRLVQTCRRNRDLVTSLMRGLKSLRPMTFKFIEEDIPEAPKEAKKKEPKINKKKIDDLKIPEPLQEPKPETEGPINA